jgi:hypothetical protein
MSDNPEVTEPEVQPWDQVAEEPDEQYMWFHDYYLEMGYRRTIRGAHAAWVVATNPPGSQRLGKADQARKWSRAAEDWEWFKRATAYDAYSQSDALTAVKQAQLNLKLATVAAVDALIKNLDNPRTGVAAAKEILDRGGIPGRTISDNITTVHISADDMAQAAREVEEWETKILGESGSSVSGQ